MTRISLTDGSGWFDIDKAEVFEDVIHWNGYREESLSADFPYEKDMLYRTATGRWVLRSIPRSAWRPDEEEKFECLPDIDAAEWFVKNRYRKNTIPKKLRSLAKPIIEINELSEAGYGYLMSKLEIYLEIDINAKDVKTLMDRRSFWYNCRKKQIQPLTVQKWVDTAKLMGMSKRQIRYRPGVDQDNTNIVEFPRKKCT